MATFTFSDNVGISGYGVNQSNTEEPSYTETSNTSITWTASSAGTYYVWVKDTVGNKSNSSFTIVSTAFCAYNVGQTWNYGYTGNEKMFTTACTGTYKLEVWGAQGGTTYGYNGGYGGYSVGLISLSKDNTLFINVGGAGNANGTGAAGGYNGGGSSSKNSSQQAISRQGSGGGATHISTQSGLLKALANFKNNILIVSGGGGGSNYWPGMSEYGVQFGYGGHAGGYIGNSGTSTCSGLSTCHNPGGGGTQTTNGTSQGVTAGFGYGGNGNSSSAGGSGGGSGFYGGGGSLDNAGGGGGSSYIGNSRLYNKVMYCYNCSQSSEVSTKTISTTCTNSTPIENCSKQGNGYARITLVSLSN